MDVAERRPETGAKGYGAHHESSTELACGLTLRRGASHRRRRALARTRPEVCRPQQAGCRWRAPFDIERGMFRHLSDFGSPS